MALYGSTLNDRIDLLMADGSLFTTNFCCVNKIIFGLKELFRTYSIKKSYFLFFHFVGDSTFEITIFSKSLMSICNPISNEKDISESSDDLSGGMIDLMFSILKWVKLVLILHWSNGMQILIVQCQLLIRVPFMVTNLFCWLCCFLLFIVVLI